jgi:hypothetical protein
MLPNYGARGVTQDELHGWIVWSSGELSSRESGEESGSDAARDRTVKLRLVC